MRKQCPKCRSKKIEIREHWTYFLTWTPDAEGKYEKEGWSESGEPFKVTAECLDCHHRWTLRGVTQIQDYFMEG
jgi:hypothetical protein